MGYFDVHGVEISFYEWSKLLVDDQYAQVARTQIHGRIGCTDVETDLTVNTRWLGINMGNSDGPIQVFETAVWVDPQAKLWVDRYSTREQSRAGHAQCVWCIYSGLDPFTDPPPDPKCITCQRAPVRERLRTGSWLCLECEVEVNCGNLLHPIAKVMV